MAGREVQKKKFVVVLLNVILHMRFFGQPVSSYLVVALSIVLSVTGLSKLGQNLLTTLGVCVNSEFTRKLTRRVAEAYRSGFPARVQSLMEVRRGLDARVLDTRAPAPASVLALERARAAVEKGAEIVHLTASTEEKIDLAVEAAVELASARAFRAHLQPMVGVDAVGTETAADAQVAADALLAAAEAKMAAAMRAAYDIAASSTPMVEAKVVDRLVAWKKLVKEGASSTLNFTLVVHVDNYVARVGKCKTQLKVKEKNTLIVYTLNGLVSELTDFSFLLAPSQRCTPVSQPFSINGAASVMKIFNEKSNEINLRAPEGCTSLIVHPLLGNETWMPDSFDAKNPKLVCRLVDFARLRYYSSVPAVEAMSSSYEDYKQKFIERLNIFTGGEGKGHISELFLKGHCIICHDTGENLSLVFS